MAKLEQEFKIITPKMAVQILEESTYEKQRPIRDWHVMRLAQNITEGLWRRGSQIEFAVLPSGKMILVDGTHRQWAVIEADKPAHFSILYSPAANMMEVAERYALHNQLQLARGRTEIADIIKELYNISNYDARIAIEATKCIAAGLRHFTATTDPRVATDPTVIIENVDEWIKEIKILSDIRKTAEPRGNALFKKRWVGAICLVAIRYHKEKGIEFTKRLMMDNAPVGCPTRILLSWAFPTSRAIKRKPLEFLPATCQAFNMFLIGKKSKGNLAVPEVKVGWMTGTPYKLDRVVKTEMEKYKQSKRKSTTKTLSAHDPHNNQFATKQ
jgi:hypothetical protein